MMDVYHAWNAAWRADPANYPPGEWAMWNYIDDPGSRAEALAELLAAGFADRAANGEIVINQQGAQLEHEIHMYDR